RDGLDGAAVDVDVGEDRRRRHVPVPDGMMDELEVPFAHAGFEIDRNEAFGEQIGAWPMAAVIVRCRRLDRYVDEAQLLIDRNMRPHSGVAVVHPGIVLPGLVAELAWPWNCIPAPQLLAGANVPGTHDALGVVVSRHCRAFPHG